MWRSAASAAGQRPDGGFMMPGSRNDPLLSLGVCPITRGPKLHWHSADRHVCHPVSFQDTEQGGISPLTSPSTQSVCVCVFVRAPYVRVYVCVTSGFLPGQLFHSCHFTLNVCLMMRHLCEVVWTCVWSDSSPNSERAPPSL